MNYWLMHKNDRIAHLELDDKNGEVVAFKTIIKEKIPAYADSVKAMREWWQMRAVPKSRNMLLRLLLKRGIASPSLPMVRNLALSLSDCYWAKPEGSSLKWADVNFFDNGFKKFSISSVISEQIADDAKNIENSSNLTPYYSLNGQMPKYWEIQNGKRILVKQADDMMSRHQCMNELFGMILHEKLNMFTCAEYSLTFNDEHIISGVASPCFCNGGLEYIPMVSLLPESQIIAYNGNSLREKLLNSLENAGMNRTECDKFISYLHLTDFIISNVDRHLNNFGIMRDPDTLKAVGFAPIFDNGNSMLYNDVEDYYSISFKTLKTKSYGIYSTDEKMLRGCKTGYDMINLSLLPTAHDVYEKYKTNLFRYATQNAMFVAKAYDYKIKVLEMVRDGIPLHDIISMKVSVPEWMP